MALNIEVDLVQGGFSPLNSKLSKGVIILVAREKGGTITLELQARL